MACSAMRIGCRFYFVPFFYWPLLLPAYTKSPRVGVPFRDVWQFLSPHLCKLSGRLFKFYDVCLSSSTIVFEYMTFITN